MAKSLISPSWENNPESFDCRISFEETEETGESAQFIESQDITKEMASRERVFVDTQENCLSFP